VFILVIEWIQFYFVNIAGVFHRVFTSRPTCPQVPVLILTCTINVQSLLYQSIYLYTSTVKHIYRWFDCVYSYVVP